MSFCLKKKKKKKKHSQGKGGGVRIADELTGGGVRIADGLANDKQYDLCVLLTLLLSEWPNLIITLLHSEQLKLYRVLAVLSAVALRAA